MNGGRFHFRLQWTDLITATGLLLTVNEALFRVGPERPGMQFVFLAMMGISPAVRIDERRHQQRQDRESSELVRKQQQRRRRSSSK